MEQDKIAELRKLEDKEIELDKLRQDYEKLENNKIADPVVKQIADSVKQAEAAQKAAVKAQTQAQNELTRATEKHAEAKTKLTEAEQKLKDMRGLTNNETVQAQIDALDIKIDGYAAKLDAANDDVSKKQEALTTLKSENITEEQARSNYNSAQQAYLAAQQALYNENQEVSEKKAAIDDASDALDDAKDNLADKEAALADRQKELDKAVADSTDTTVKAPIAGTISNVSVTAGSKTEAAQTMCTIFVSDQGYKVTFTVTREQANRIHVGDEARAQYFWGGECQASVAAIKPDPSNAQQRIVDLNVSGDVTVGQTMTFTLGDRSAEYDTVVPNSAIREDRNGKYVHVVESRSTPLGTRYTAARVDVQVAASDETQSALSTSLYGNEFIITASTKPINAGDLVRLVNN
ncbi:MAG: efflux RND transporter periplasmic adaptor subunit [Clostridia bacterium]|nr:efflux RND transporter periplasmic adaptor subunit [Clostridia bacterium]